MAVALDVLPLLDAASEHMTLGDLLAGQSFDMQDAMSALEVMDPQMDTGMKSASSAADDDDTPDPVLPAEPSAPFMIGLLDEVLCAEHGWYRGLTLAQTVYAVEWMYSAPDVEHLPLRAALVATARGVAAARAIVLRGDVHEEEDFASSISGLRLHDRVPDGDLVQLLNAAEAHAQAALKTARDTPQPTSGAVGATDTPTGDAAAGAPPSAADAAVEPESVRVASAVLCRLRFRRGMCGALLNLQVRNLPISPSATSPDLPPRSPQTFKPFSSMCAAFRDLQRAQNPQAGASDNDKLLGVAQSMLAHAHAQLDEMEATIALGTGRVDLTECLQGRAVRRALGPQPQA